MDDLVGFLFVCAIINFNTNHSTIITHYSARGQCEQLKVQEKHAPKRDSNINDLIIKIKHTERTKEHTTYSIPSLYTTQAPTDQ